MSLASSKGLTTEPVFFACWVSNGEWEVRVDHPHLPNGRRHVHIRRKHGRKGEYSWNEDGTRHDKHRFPVSEGMIGKAKQIAAHKLNVPIGTLTFLTGLPKGGRIVILLESIPWVSEVYFFAEIELVVLVSENWLVLVAPHFDDIQQNNSGTDHVSPRESNGLLKPPMQPNSYSSRFPSGGG